MIVRKAETPVGGGLTGPTFNCIKALQFKKLMDGDRFFFTHKDQTGSFTPTQLEEIRKRYRSILSNKHLIVLNVTQCHFI